MPTVHVRHKKLELLRGAELILMRFQYISVCIVEADTKINNMKSLQEFIECRAVFGTVVKAPFQMSTFHIRAANPTLAPIPNSRFWNIFRSAHIIQHCKSPSPWIQSPIEETCGVQLGPQFLSNFLLM